MKKFSLIALAALCVVAPLQALDLTARQGFRDLEGFKIPVLNFADAGRRVRWQPPAKWQISGGGQKLVVSEPDLVQATMELSVLERPPAGADSLPTPQDRQLWVRQFLPKDAREITFIGENASPFDLHGQPSREILLRYILAASRYSASISFVDLHENQRIVVNITARDSDFAAVRSTAIASMFSWNWLD